jgi:hypothetical protein
VDADVLHEGLASLTPLHLDRTSYRSIKPLSGWTDLLDPALQGRPRPK